MLSERFVYGRLGVGRKRHSANRAVPSAKEGKKVRQATLRFLCETGFPHYFLCSFVQFGPTFWRYFIVIALFCHAPNPALISGSTQQDSISNCTTY
jgi:hypothetical protein